MFSHALQRIMKAQYDIPADVVLSPECQDMLRRLLTVRPRHRITIAAIRECATTF